MFLQHSAGSKRVYELQHEWQAATRGPRCCLGRALRDFGYSAGRVPTSLDSSAEDQEPAHLRLQGRSSIGVLDPASRPRAFRGGRGRGQGAHHPHVQGARRWQVAAIASQLQAGVVLPQPARQEPRRQELVVGRLHVPMRANAAAAAADAPPTAATAAYQSPPAQCT